MSRTTNLSRPAAKAQLVELRIALMDGQEKDAVLAEWWTIDEEDAEWAKLPKLLRDEMACHEEPLEISQDSRYLPLLMAATSHELIGVTNEWLGSRLAEYGEDKTQVVGTVERLEPCPCCSYRTLHERGQYYICPVCFWEDDGSDELERHSGPNHKSLTNGRSLFTETGVSDQRFVDIVSQDIQTKFVAASDSDLTSK